LAIDLVTTNHQLSPNWADRFKLVIVTEEDQLLRTIDKSLSNLQLQVVLEKIKLVYSELEKEEEEAKVDILLQQLKELNETKGMLANILGTVILG
jgi:hypothetical protein